MLESPDNFKVSKFNAAFLKMDRLHQCMAEMNRLRSDMLGFDQITGAENYKLFFSHCHSLHEEVAPKMQETQAKELERMRKTIKAYISKLPARTTLKRHSSSKGELVVKAINWEKIEEALYLYEKLIRAAIDKHGYDSPEMDEFSGYD